MAPAPRPPVSRAGTCPGSLTQGWRWHLSRPCVPLTPPPPHSRSLSPHPPPPPPTRPVTKAFSLPGPQTRGPTCGLAGRGPAGGRVSGHWTRSGPAASSSGRQPGVCDVSRAGRLAAERRALSSGLRPPRPGRHGWGLAGTKAAFSARGPGKVGEQRRPLRRLFWEAGDKRGGWQGAGLTLRWIFTGPCAVAGAQRGSGTAGPWEGVGAAAPVQGPPTLSGQDAKDSRMEAGRGRGGGETGGGGGGVGRGEGLLAGAPASPPSPRPVRS